MEKKGLDIIYQTVKGTDIKEVTIKSNRGTELRMVRSDEEIVQSKKPIKSGQPASSANTGVDIVGGSSQTAGGEASKNDILSHQVGFFNRFNPRTKQQYVKLRDPVQKGMVVGTIVAMHVHHEVVSDREGKVVEFLVEQDQPVAFNQPLIRLAEN